MPHLTIEYSSNMEQRVDMALMCDVLRRAAIATGVLPVAGVRVRAICATYVSIADGGVDHGFVDISLRLRGGRDQATRKAATAQIFDAAHEFLQAAMDEHSIALSFEMRDIDPELSPKTGTIRDHLT
ncbi:MAG: 5-carboxymethyl-2-hydroxymuconate Delta-isomerase [Rhodobacteraceae bacterium]|nr:5-carboxymethyl-2-hydroxymuconate Delta-isomerase [Paracoccaceae bacterium]